MYVSLYIAGIRRHKKLPKLLATYEINTIGINHKSTFICSYQYVTALEEYIIKVTVLVKIQSHFHQN